MSEHSITTATSYVLNKYSRSYPPTVPLGSQVPGPAESEWQHYTSPVMKIVLEAKRSPSGQLVSMRLRIFWSLHTVSSDSQTNQEVVFEDLELLSFSSLATSQASAAQSDQSLPLKAVYRDAVVGIRYLHPRTVPLGSSPTYRRFQITFKDALDASRYIDAIKAICPCKAIAGPAHISRQSTMLSAPLVRAATTMSHPEPVPARPATKMTKHQSAVPSCNNSRSLPPAMLSHFRENQALSVAPPSVEMNLSSDDGSFVTCPEISHRSDTQVDRRKDDDLPKSRDPDNWAPSSLPNSSQPSSSDQSITMPPPPVPRRTMHHTDLISEEQSRAVNTGDERSQLLASLSKHPSLYELSRTELETLVGQVIREEGFLHLLESLDSLWRIKGLLGR